MLSFDQCRGSGSNPVLEEPNDAGMEPARTRTKPRRSRPVSSRLIGALGIVGGLLVVAAAVCIGVGELSNVYSLHAASG